MFLLLLRELAKYIGAVGTNAIIKYANTAERDGVKLPPFVPIRLYPISGWSLKNRDREGALGKTIQ